MLEIVFIVGIALFALASVGFYFRPSAPNGLRSAFQVSFVTLVSYILMWQGDLAVVTADGEPIFWSRWLFYGLSCTLLMYEIGQVKGVSGERLVQLMALTFIVMLTGFLAARDLGPVRWAHFVISSVAYALLVRHVLSARRPEGQWVNRYVFFGWTVFPLVFLLAPTGFGLIGAAVANLLYLLLDIYTKIVFGIQLTRAT